MQEKRLSVYCPVHKTSFAAPRAGRILCETGKHSLAQSFPYGDFWQYCCDCQNFYPYDASAAGGRMKQCPNCSREIARRHLCSHCKVMSMESAAPEGAREFAIAPGDAPQPACPACLELETNLLRRHECKDLAASYTTARGLCPFCNERLESAASLPATALSLILDEVRELRGWQNQLSSRLEAYVAELGRMIDEGFARQRAEIAALESRLAARGQEANTAQPRAAITPVAVPQQPNRSTLKTPAASPVKTQSAFPIPAAEYLSRVHRVAIVVKSDSLNDILVKDPDGLGEMVLIEDKTATRDLLYVAPRASSFKTKLEFHTYYEKYFDCHRPTAGEVWIVMPAVVRRVNGGWQLHEKGELEVR